MPGRLIPPDIEEPQETEQLKKPKKRGSGTRRPRSQEPLNTVESPPPTVPPDPPPTGISVAPPDTPTVPAAATAAAPTPPPSEPPASKVSSLSPDPLSTPATPSSLAVASSDTPPPAAPPYPASAATGSDPNSTNRPPKPGAEASPPGGVITINGIDFHHASEAEFARLLTYYGIDWQYEPHQFALQWRDGRPIEMFTPDFYLTEYDLYIELTTMRQSLVRRKNRKLRLIRALYPDINIKLLYRRDYQRLLERFGIMSEEVEAEMPGVAANVTLANEVVE
jgi:hypothetical protein